MATHWYLKNSTNERGPLEFRELIDLARTGAISAADQVRSTHHKDWQPAAGVLHDYFPAAGKAVDSSWSETVNAAMAAARARRGGAKADADTPRESSLSLGTIGRMFGGILTPIAWLATPAGWLLEQFEWIEELFDAAAKSVWMSVGLRAASALLAGIAATWLVRTWSVQLALQQMRRAVADGRLAPSRYFPLVGECSAGEYWFLTIDVFIAAAIAGWFASNWLMKTDEQS